MIAVKSVFKLVIIFSFLVLSFAGKGYAEDEPNVSEVESYKQGMANSFEEALEKNKQLSERYKTVNAEQQKQMKERWQEHKAKWDSLSEEEKAEKKKMMQEHKANRGSKGGVRGER